MNLNPIGFKPLIGVITTLAIAGIQMPQVLAQGWTFNVSNNGPTKIVKIQAAEMGSSDWGDFTGSAIDPGETVTLEWAPSTNNSDCKWQLRALYADGPSNPATFDFCQETDLEFDN